jgi:Tol biopolymer transport system component
MLGSKEDKMKFRSFKTLSAVVAILVIAAMAIGPFSGATISARAAAGDIMRISVSSSEAQANGGSVWADVSADGRYIVFQSGASNLVAGNTNDDIFLRDQQLGETSRISVSSGGVQANGGAYYPSISGDGRYVAFQSEATNLVAGDTNGFIDIFLRDRQTGTTTRVSVGPAGVQANDNSDSYTAISADGRFVAFSSDATNLVSGDTNGFADTFVYDRQTGVTERVSIDSNEAEANDRSFDPAISADGRFVVFSSGATNLVAGDTNGKWDIFVRDRQLGVTTRASVNSSGVEVDRDAREPAISADGRYIVFSSDATNMLDEEAYGYPHVYVHDQQTGETEAQSFDSQGYQMVGWAENPDISADGRYVAFHFNDRGDGLPTVFIYVHDRLTGATTLVSGSYPDDAAFSPSLSGNGKYVAFSSDSAHLIAGDTNAAPDIYMRELANPPATAKTFQSVGGYDGWVIESGENDEIGGKIDAGSSTFYVGDGSNDQQYRSILHFDTSSLPNNAQITKVTLKIKRQGLVGTNPFNTHGSLLVDIRKPFFDSRPDLQPQDFQALSDLHPAGTVANVPGAIWFSAVLDPAAFSWVNLAGPTQLRLRFALDDNNDNDQDYLRFYSGNASSADRPVLTVEYYSSPTGSPVVTGILRADPDPIAAGNVHFTVAFSEPVTGVDAGDFALTTTGVSGASISSLTGSGDTYTVTVSTGTGTGTVRLDLVDDDSIQDGSSHRLGGYGPGNGNFTGGEVYTVASPSVFADVPADHLYAGEIEILYANRLTAGCSTNPLKFCPDQIMDRGQAAVFILRGTFTSAFIPAPATHFFVDDWSIGPWAEPWAEAMKTTGISAGCRTSPPKFCPWDQIPREQAAIFALRLENGVDYTPPPASGTMFADLTDTSDYYIAWEEQAYADGLLPDCGMVGTKPKICPKALVSRGLAAYMIVNAKDLTMP